MSSTGKFLTAEVNGANVDGTHEWSVQRTADRLEATTGADRGAGRKDGGVVDTKVTITFYFDIVSGRFVEFDTGNILVGLNLFTTIDSSVPQYAIDEAEVFDVTFRGQIRGQFVVTVECEAKGDVVTGNDAG
jgi:hypothetical protein